MSLKLPQLFGVPVPTATETTSTSPQTERPDHRRMLRVALRDTLKRAGIPGEWVGVDALVRRGKTHEPRLDVRLIVRHWDTNLIVSSMALQEEFKRCLQTLDPTAPQWLTAVSWQFALPEGAQYPQLPLPNAQGAVAGPAPAALAALPSPTSGRLPASALRDALVQLLDEPPDAEPKDRAYAATVPAALH